MGRNKRKAEFLSNFGNGCNNFIQHKNNGTKILKISVTSPNKANRILIAKLRFLKISCNFFNVVEISGTSEISQFFLLIAATHWFLLGNR